MRGRKDIGHRIGGMLADSALKNERINKLVLDTQNPVKFLTPNAVMALGYEDRLIIDFCRALLEQRRLKVLPDYALPEIGQWATLNFSSHSGIWLRGWRDEETAAGI